MLTALVYTLVLSPGLSTGEMATLLSLQGLVNREAPQLYISRGPDQAEAHWVSWYESYHLTPETRTFREALQRYAPKAKGYILYDPALPDSLNIAMIMAGIQQALVCAPEGAAPLQALGLKELADLRERWKTPVEAYAWAFDTLFPQCDARVLANYEQRGKGGIRPTMDYLAAKRGFCLGLTINAAEYPEEAALWDKALRAAPDHAMMLGWHTSKDVEATHVHFCSERNTWVYCAGAYNMSFHQHVQAKQPYEQQHCEQAICDPEARYVAITLSDGDSWHSMADVQKNFWLHPDRGKVPVGWEVAPIFAEVGPALFEYYYQSATEADYLLCGPSGIAYNYLCAFPDWEGYLRHTAAAMKKASLRTIWTINRQVRHREDGCVEHRLKDRSIAYTKAQVAGVGNLKNENGADWVDPQSIDRYMEGIPEAPGFFQGWERIPGESPRWVKGKLWAPTVALLESNVEAAVAEFDAEAARQPRPAFLPGHVNCYDATMADVVAIARALEAKGYTVVRPDVFLQLGQDAFRRGLRR